MEPQVLSLGHVGIFVRDLDKMASFYRDFLGLTVTKQDWRKGIVFLSSDPERTDHEIALIRGRPEGENPKLIEQISLRVSSLEDVRTFYHRLVDQGFKIDKVVNHCSAIGCYYFDPEGNRAEVFWETGRTTWTPTLELIDIDLPDGDIMARVDAVYERFKEVPVGGSADESQPVHA